MVSNQILKETLNKIREASGIDFTLYRQDATVITADYIRKSDELKTILPHMTEDAGVQEYQDRLFFNVFDSGNVEYVLSCPRRPSAELAGKLAVIQFEQLIETHQERQDKDNFIKNLLMDNLLPVDIYNRAKKLNINPRRPRVAFLIETRSRDNEGVLETIRSMFAENENDFAASIDESNIVLVKELRSAEDDQELKLIAGTIADMMNTEVMTQVRVAYGNVASEIRKVSNSYKEAKLAMSVGKIFNSEQNIISYASLGIGRLIYQLPLPMCKMFIEEIFKDKSPETFDEETLTTINQFFENSLNVSETSRQLYIHRNTLVYRLDKIQKNTGLDLRVFDDAITFKIALMVVQYMRYMEKIGRVD
ncbi:MAG: helix-turn-helix domain-containing protein [Lachnospiraceae bacterium]|nr:helix-turn-helix domain-containing protein [Lachnospiraceae bacterium]